MSDTDTTFNFVIAMLQSQLFNLLCDKADDEYGGRLPVHVRCILDEFANIGQIPNFDKLIATIRSREISASIILQSQSQLKTIYKDAADTIVGNCDTTLFLGGKEKSTLKELSEILGKETIDSFNTSENRGTQVSHGLNYQKLGKELMSQDEIAVMDGGKCILQVRGTRPFLSDKFDITAHKNYKYLADADKKIGAFSGGMKQRLGLAIAMLGTPELLVLDEPINGLDPEGIAQLREVIANLHRERGVTIFISSHILGELSKIATHYGIIKDGELIEQITAEELSNKLKDYLTVKVENARLASDILSQQLDLPLPEVVAQDELHIHNYKDTAAVNKVLYSNDFNVKEVFLHQQDLEEYFIELMGGQDHE